MNISLQSDAIEWQNHRLQSKERWAALNRANSSHELDSFVTVERLKMEWLREIGNHLLKMEEVYSARLDNWAKWYKHTQHRRLIRQNSRELLKAEGAYSKKIKQVAKVQRLLDGLSTKRRHTKPGWLMLSRWFRGDLSGMPSTTDLLVCSKFDTPIATEPMKTKTLIDLAAEKWARINIDSPPWEEFQSTIFAVRDSYLAGGQLLLASIDKQAEELASKIGKLDG